MCAMQSGNDQIRLLSYNIHVGIEVGSLSEYCLNIWKHALPSRCKLKSISKISAFLSGYDVVALQEVDLGSLRTKFINQAELIAQSAGFRHLAARQNRNLGIVAQHGMAILSRYPISQVSQFNLPGRVPGRGILCCRIQSPFGSFDLFTTHLSLGYADRTLQLKFLRLLVSRSKNFILMGDFNCVLHEIQHIFAEVVPRARQPAGKFTYPSWCASRQFDHILSSENCRLDNYRVVPYICSDHLPVEAVFSIPN